MKECPHCGALGDGIDVVCRYCGQNMDGTYNPEYSRWAYSDTQQNQEPEKEPDYRRATRPGSGEQWREGYRSTPREEARYRQWGGQGRRSPGGQDRQNPGAPPYSGGTGPLYPMYRGKSKIVTAILAITLGCFGVHKFYLGNYKMGLLYLVFFWSSITWVIGIIEGINYLLMNERDFQERYCRLDTPMNPPYF